MRITFHNKQAENNLPKLQVNGNAFCITIPISKGSHCKVLLRLSTHSNARLFFDGKLQSIDFDFENEVMRNNYLVFARSVHAILINQWHPKRENLKVSEFELAVDIINKAFSRFMRKDLYNIVLVHNDNIPNTIKLETWDSGIGTLNSIKVKCTDTLENDLKKIKRFI